LLDGDREWYKNSQRERGAVLLQYNSVVIRRRPSERRSGRSVLALASGWLGGMHETYRRNFSSPRHAPPKIHFGEKKNQTKKSNREIVRTVRRVLEFRSALREDRGWLVV
jgi:hypothetical protein